ncbi:hypothetical protein [Rubellimicrobium arenae]|uniref:hypothetical protein n=1 Tax=Rubellimicrobium arenae TaxID=2817372 RepID=UPI001B313399|nr:hypothetical protein [Rubellimicrobium arenae]
MALLYLINDRTNGHRPAQGEVGLDPLALAASVGAAIEPGDGLVLRRASPKSPTRTVPALPVTVAPTWTFDGPIVLTIPGGAWAFSGTVVTAIPGA